MASANLTWVNGGGANSTGQEVQFKLPSSGVWTVFSTEPPTATSKTVTGLLPDTIYDFRIVDVCSDGGPTPSAQIQGAFLTCPVLTVTELPTALSYSMTHIGGDITRYLVRLYDSTGVNLMQTKQHDSPSGTMSSTFSGLTPSTAYVIQVVVFAGPSFSFSKVCATLNHNTADPATCAAPTGVTVTMVA